MRQCKSWLVDLYTMRCFTKRRQRTCHGVVAGTITWIYMTSSDVLHYCTAVAQLTSADRRTVIKKSTKYFLNMSVRRDDDTPQSEVLTELIEAAQSSETIQSWISHSRSSDFSQTCYLCTEAFEPAQPFGRRARCCDAIFHDKCLYRYLSWKYGECPLCSADFTNLVSPRLFDRVRVVDSDKSAD